MCCSVLVTSQGPQSSTVVRELERRHEDLVGPDAELACQPPKPGSKTVVIG